jgi:hypothetical protein
MEAHDKVSPAGGRLLFGAAWLAIKSAGSPLQFGKQQGTPTAAPAPAGQPPKAELRFPSHELAAMYDAAKASPQSFAAVYAYAKALSDHCQGMLVDTSCGPYCAGGPVRYKPASALAPDNRLLVENALPKVDVLMSTPGLSSTQTGQLVAVKARLLGFCGRGADERALVDRYASEHADAFPVVRRRLELLRDAGDAKESESQCSRSRGGMKSAPEEARIELLTTCVALHPDNQRGKDDPPDYARYLPRLASEEQKLYRKHMLHRCQQDSDAHEAQCSRLCACDDRPWDKKYTAHCKEVCKGCRAQAVEKLKGCKKYRRK